MIDPKVAADYEEYKAAGRIWGVIDKENIKMIKGDCRWLQGTGGRPDRNCQRPSGRTGLQQSDPRFCTEAHRAGPLDCWHCGDPA